MLGFGQMIRAPNCFAVFLIKVLQQILETIPFGQKKEKKNTPKIIMLALSFVEISQETRGFEHMVLSPALGYGGDVLLDLCKSLCKRSTLYIVIPGWIASGSDPVLQLYKIYLYFTQHFRCIQLSKYYEIRFLL